MPLPLVACPACHHPLKHDEGSRAPTPDDWFVCGSCATILRCDATLSPVVPQPGEYDALRLTHPDLWQVISHIRNLLLHHYVRN